MSSTAPLRHRLPRMAPRTAQAAVRRARLRVVPRPRTRATTAPRVPFVTLVSVVLLTGVVGLLLFNTSMQQASFRATALERQASDLSAREEALALEVQGLRDPRRVAQEAQRMGMVIPGTPSGILDLDTGRIVGDPRPASPADSLPLFAPPPARPAELDPAPVTVRRDRPDGTGDGRRDGARDGVPERDRDAGRHRLGERRPR